MFSVLQNKENIKFRFDKFPYLIIDDALPKDIYKKYYTPKHFVNLGINKIRKLIKSIGKTVKSKEIAVQTALAMRADDGDHHGHALTPPLCFDRA